MVETKVYVYMGLGLLLFIRAIINNSIINARDNTNYSAFAFDNDINDVMRSLKVGFTLWIKPEKSYKKKAWISNVMFLLAIVLFIYSIYIDF